MDETRSKPPVLQFWKTGKHLPRAGANTGSPVTMLSITGSIARDYLVTPSSPIPAFSDPRTPQHFFFLLKRQKDRVSDCPFNGLKIRCKIADHLARINEVTIKLLLVTPQSAAGQSD